MLAILFYANKIVGENSKLIMVPSLIFCFENKQMF